MDDLHDLMPSRRRFLQLGGASVLGLALAGCGGGDDPATSDTTASPSSATTGGSATTEGSAATTVATDETSTSVPAGSELTAADFEGLGTCVLLPELTAGPFPLDEQFDRRDITEGSEGHPLRLGLRVVDETCEPVPGAAVEIWHCDATGDYSAFTDGGGGKDEGTGTTFLRGTQTANDEGIVEFLTIYPGWYTGRAVHIHLRVHLDDQTVLTSQLFFDEGYTDSVYSAAPYTEFGPADTSNAADAIAGDPEGDGTLLSPVPGETANGTGSLALLNLGIDPSATSASGGGGTGGGPGA